MPLHYTKQGRRGFQCTFLVPCRRRRACWQRGLLSNTSSDPAPMGKPRGRQYKKCTPIARISARARTSARRPPKLRHPNPAAAVGAPGGGLPGPIEVAHGLPSIGLPSRASPWLTARWEDASQRNNPVKGKVGRVKIEWLATTRLANSSRVESRIRL